MSKQTQRDSFVIYKSHYDAAKMLNREIQFDYIMAILEYGFYGKEPKADQINSVAMALFTAGKPTIDSAMSRRDAAVQNGSKGGKAKANNKQNASKSVANDKQTSSKSVAYVDAYVDVDVNADVNVNAYADVYADLYGVKYTWENFEERINSNKHIDASAKSRFSNRYQEIKFKVSEEMKGTQFTALCEEVHEYLKNLEK
jgi:hypothetical protein